jgi:hypothetical protein
MKTTIKAYSAIEAGIAALQQQYSHQPDCSTTAGFEQCKKDYRSIRKVETSLEKERKIQGDEARKHVALVNTEAGHIQELLRDISGPFKKARDVRQEQIDKDEADRVSGIKERILNIALFINEAHNTNSEGVSAIIESIDLIDCADNFDEFTAEALKTKQDVLEQLGQILQQKAQAEAAERDRLAAEQGRLEAECKAAIDQRINTLRMIPIDFMSKTVKEIGDKIDSLNKYSIPAEEFGDRYDEAVGAKQKVISQLGASLQQAVKLEEAEELKSSQIEFDSRAVKAEDGMEQTPETVGVDMASGPDETVTTKSGDQTETNAAPRVDAYSPEQCVARYLFDNAGLSQHQSKLVAQMIVGNQLPGVHVSAMSNG